MKNGSKIYHASVYVQDGEEKYQNPSSYILSLNYLTIQPVSGYSDIVKYGKDVDKVYKGIANYTMFKNKFKERDVLYIDGATPTGETTNGENANAYIESVDYQNKVIKLVIKKRVI